MYRSQHNNRSLQRFTVKAGSETGLYYITVANLAYRTTARQLKAFASQACEVDHVEVYDPTCGFVRVRGRANFERAFRFLDGNTLEYRALQADARNLDRSTVVFLPPNDYHAARILRGDEGRVFAEPDAPSTDPGAVTEQFPHAGSAGAGSPFPDYQSTMSPTLNRAQQTDSQRSYVTSPSYVSDGGYQPATPSAAVAASSQLVYQAAAPSNHGFIQPVATSSHPAMQPSVYQAVPSPAHTSAQPTTAQYQYSDPAAYYPSTPAYDIGGQGYAGYVHPTGRDSSHAYPSGYSEAWPSDPAHTTQTQFIPYQTEQPPVPIEQRKILILNLRRDSLSETTVANLLARHAGIDPALGHVIENVHLPINRDGRPRGTAYVTFVAPELAGAAVAALNGREVGGVRLEARLTEGVSSSGDGGAGGSGGGGRHNRRQGGGGGRGNGSRAGSGAVPRSARSARSVAQAAVSANIRAGSMSGSGFGSGSGSGPGAASGSGTASGSGSGSEGGSSQRRREEPPVIVDGSGGRWKKGDPPVVVGGGAGERGGGG